MRTDVPAVLVLEDGRAMHGDAYGAVGTTFGEAVFSTGMSGYQETLTDPSYHRQVVIMTAPHIGNTGVNDEDPESSRIWVAGYVVRDPSRIASNWRATQGLEDRLVEQGIVGISGIDTRALTRHLRERGAMRVGIFSGADAERTPAELLSLVQASPEMEGADLTGDVTTAGRLRDPGRGGEALHRRGRRPRHQVHDAARDGACAGWRSTSSRPPGPADQIRGLQPDGVFFSNGPGDPATADSAVALMSAFLRDGTPVFGICFGNQVLGRALGLGTYKLRFGHRGINQPVKDLASGRVAVTAHNHGFAVDAPRSGEFDTPFGRATVSHVCLNDDVVEGLRCLDVPAFSVQYHPEAAAGPHDADYLFDQFAALMDAAREGRTA